MLPDQRGAEGKETPGHACARESNSERAFGLLAPRRDDESLLVDYAGNVFDSLLPTSRPVGLFERTLRPCMRTKGKTKQ